MDKLSERRILITRAEEDCKSWADQLRLLGAVPIIFPCIECEPIISKTILGRLGREVPCAHWLVFTSRRGVDAFAALYEKPLPEKLKIAVVGPTTAQTAGEKLGRVDFISEESTAISLGRELGKKIKSPCRLIMALAENAGKILEGELDSAGKECVRLDLYRTIPKKSQGHRRKISSLGADSIIRDFSYRDNRPWPRSADGTGYSLVLRAPESLPDHSLAVNWRSSALPDGNPGSSDALPEFTGDPHRDDDQDGLMALLEHALGGDPAIAESELVPAASVMNLEVEGTFDNYLTISARRMLGADDVTLMAQISGNLVDWSSAPERVVLVSEVPNADGTSIITWRSAGL